jgi:two-component system nitrate/nitrite response regulator NarL
VILKETATELLLKCVRAVVAGEYWIGRDSVSDLVRYLQAGDERERATSFGLTPRERQVVRAVAAGSTNKDIAAELRISEDTVKHHLTNIFDKVGVSTRLELALFATARGLHEGGGDTT